MQSIRPEQEVFQRLKIKLNAKTESKLRLEQKRKQKAHFKEKVHTYILTNAAVREEGDGLPRFGKTVSQVLPPGALSRTSTGRVYGAAGR